MLHHNTRAHACHKTHPFDRQLSLAIDATHDELNRLHDRRGLRAWWRRWQLRRQLRKLEAQVPR